MQARQSALRRNQHSLAYEWAIISAAVTLITFVLVAGSWTSKLDQVLYDAGIALHERDARDDVVIVGIDDESIAAVGRWPWRRAVIARLINSVSAAKPKAIGIDILFSEKDTVNAGDDALLAEALKREPNVVLPILTVQGREVSAIPSIAENANMAKVDVSLDADGVLRRVNLAPTGKGQSRQHMAQKMLQTVDSDAQSGTQKMPDYDFAIPFIGPPGKVNHVSAAAVLRGEVPGNLLSNKYVLIGVTASGLADSYATPSTTIGRLMPGVEVTANVLTALLDGRSITPLGKYTIGVVSAVVTLILLIVFYRAAPGISVYLMFFTVVLIPILSLLLLGDVGIWFPPMSVAISALIAYPLWHWKRLESICYYLDEEIVKLESDQPSAPDALPSGTVGFADYIQNRIDLIRVNINYLRAARSFLNESLDGLPNAALVIAPDGKLMVANRGALALCGRDKKQIEGRSIDLALNHLQLDGMNWVQAVAAALADETLKQELKATDRSGREFEVALAEFRNDSGVVSGLIVVLDDVTELRHAQREREVALSFLSHDIRSPQNSIMALAELQRHDETRKTEAEFVASVETLAQKTMLLAEDFMQLIRADSKPLNLAEHDLVELIDDGVAEIDPQARTKNIAIQVSRLSDPVLVNVDRSLIMRAIGNLLGNAIKYTPRGGKVRIFCELSDDLAVCNVSDSGSGIDQSDLPKLFKRFSRLQSADGKVAGSGLGLAFVDVVARRHFGSTRVVSERGAGTTFSFTLPLLKDVLPH